MDEEKSFLMYLSSAAIIVVAFVLLVGCTTNTKEKEHYKIYWGKRCTEDGQKFSYVWLHTTQGPDQVKKEWCKS